MQGSWTRLKEVFEQVVDLPQAQQGPAGRELLGADADAIARLDALLVGDRNSGSMLDLDIFSASCESPACDPQMPTEIGPYRILQRLGEGGMSVVYLAERRSVGGKVAIKFLRACWLSATRQARFAREQQLLASLNHPSIAHLYEANFLADGTPWFAMEFVEGVPITEVRAGNLNEALDLIRKTCEAVRYAHSFAIIHRDLKPSNILVTADRQVKLLDFGIAKQIRFDGMEDVTAEGLSPLTPAYAAPEQKSGGNIGVFTDIYALGVILYELIIGTLPATHSRDEPVRLGQALRKGDSVIHVPRLYHADLDLLCATCTTPESQNRYGSIDALMRDLDAFSEGRPLHAKRADFRTVATKYLRRNRHAVLATSGATLLLIAVSTYFTLRLAQSRTQALAASERAQRMREFTEGLFEGGTASAGPKVQLTIPDLLRRGEITADSMRNEPRVQADMLSTLGTVYQHIGNLDRADRLLTRAVPETAGAYGPRSPEHIESEIALGLLRRDQGRMQDAEITLRAALLQSVDIQKGGGPERERAAWGLGSVEALRGNYQDSKHWMLEALGDAQRGKRLESEQYVFDLQGLADDDFYVGDYSAARDLYLQALALGLKINGGDHPSVGHIYNGLGNIALNLNHLPRSLDYLQRSLNIDERWYGDSHPDVADDLVAVSRPLILMKRFEEAQTDLARSLAILHQVYGDEHSRVASAYTSLGLLAFQQKDLSEAERDFTKSLAIWTRVYGPTHQFVGLSYANLASVAMEQGDFAKAIGLFHKALLLFEAGASRDGFNAAVLHMKLGRALLRSRQYARAVPESLLAYHYFLRTGNQQSPYRDGAKSDLEQDIAEGVDPGIATKVNAELSDGHPEATIQPSTLTF